MITLDLKFGGKIRLWFDNVNELKVNSGFIEAKRYSGVINNSVLNGIIITEILLPRGGRNIYGLLGLRYTYADSNELKVILPVTNNQKIIFEDSLINEIEPAFVGLSSTYSKFILDRINILNGNKQLLLAGKLDLCYAATSEVSSNGWVFDKLTNIVLNLMRIPVNKIDSEMLVGFLNSTE